ncbi:hypothetical protein B0T19DRAFT_168283 [Cercophora scortea]|uniref:Uncharacterized protein n=1 Tax=Cercophora scortea TaxID=314031 RepID=A0AAE0INH6_9PEZI|nr:hypothetical protein B0T19DRAFT_168283 [Cercophora scortea]
MELTAGDGIKRPWAVIPAAMALILYLAMDVEGATPSSSPACYFDTEKYDDNAWPLASGPSDPASSISSRKAPNKMVAVAAGVAMTVSTPDLARCESLITTTTTRTAAQPRHAATTAAAVAA